MEAVTWPCTAWAVEGERCDLEGSAGGVNNSRARKTMFVEAHQLTVGWVWGASKAGQDV
jgi:hypothetical protein